MTTHTIIIIDTQYFLCLKWKYVSNVYHGIMCMRSYDEHELAVSQAWEHYCDNLSSATEVYYQCPGLRDFR